MSNELYLLKREAVADEPIKAYAHINPNEPIKPFEPLKALDPLKLYAPDEAFKMVMHFVPKALPKNYLNGLIKLALLALLLLCLCYGCDCFAADNKLLKDSAIVQTFMHYKNSIILMQGRIISFARVLNMYGVLMCITILGFVMIFQRADFTFFTVSLIKLMFLVGILQFLIKFGFSLALDVIDSFIQLSVDNNGGANTIDLTKLLVALFELAEAYANIVSLTSNFLIYYILMFLMYLAIAGIIGIFLMAYISALFSCAVGVIMLGFAAFPTCHMFVGDFLRVVIFQGIRLMSVTMVYFMSYELIFNLVHQMKYNFVMGIEIKHYDIGMIVFILYFVLACSYFIPKTIVFTMMHFGFLQHSFLMYHDTEKIKA